MASLFSKPKAPPLPPVPAPPITPQSGMVDQTSDAAIKKATQRSGLQRTIITGDLQPADTGKRRLLGS